MPNTVEAGFESFLGTLRTTPTETDAAKGHRTSIKSKLDNTFGGIDFFRTGSFGNGTNVAGCSDVDYFAVIAQQQAYLDSGRTLEQVAVALRERFPTTPNIRVNGPSVRVPFGLDGAEATEIVPVYEIGLTRLGFREFRMPDGNGGWKFSAPESHNDYVRVVDQKHDGAVKPLVRFAKAWKFLRNVPIKSFYLEIRIADYAYGEGRILYDVDVKQIFQFMLSDALATVVDPRFPNDNQFLLPCNTALQRADAISKLAVAAERASDAVELRREGKIRQAFQKWNLIFNGAFPLYTP